MMTDWEKEAMADKTYANTVLFFNDKMNSIETYQENSGNSAKHNGFGDANAAVEITKSLERLL